MSLLTDAQSIPDSGYAVRTDGGDPNVMQNYPVQPGTVDDLSGSASSSGEGISLADLREDAPPVAGGEASGIEMPDMPTSERIQAPNYVDPAQAAASGATASTAGTVNAEATGYNAQTGEVDPNTMTAAGQLNQITSQDSANMRRAANQGMLAAGARGLQNSSFAAGAAQGAMVDRATPLAQQDAQTYFANMRNNLEAQNRAAEVSTGRQTEVSALNAQMEQQVNLANQQAQNQIEALNAELQTAVSQQNADMANRIRQQIMDIEAGINSRNAEMANQIAMQQSDIQAGVNTRQAELATQVSMANADAVNRMNAQVLDGYQRLNEQYLRGEQAVDLAAIQGRYQQLISSNQAAASMHQTYMTAIGQAMANHEVTPQRVAQYINVMAQQLEGSLELIDAMNELNLGNIDIPGAVAGGTENIQPESYYGGPVTQPTDPNGDPVDVTNPPLPGWPNGGSDYWTNLANQIEGFNLNIP